MFYYNCVQRLTQRDVIRNTQLTTTLWQLQRTLSVVAYLWQNTAARGLRPPLRWSFPDVGTGQCDRSCCSLQQLAITWFTSLGTQSHVPEGHQQHGATSLSWTKRSGHVIKSLSFNPWAAAKQRNKTQEEDCGFFHIQLEAWKMREKRAASEPLKRVANWPKLATTLYFATDLVLNSVAEDQSYNNELLLFEVKKIMAVTRTLARSIYIPVRNSFFFLMYNDCIMRWFTCQ